MEKLTALHQHLIAQNLFDENMMDSWAEKVSPIPGGHTLTVGLADMQGMQLCVLQYDAIFVIENYKGSANLMIAQVLSWLIENDDTREQYSIGDAEFDVAPLGSACFDIEIRVPFRETLNLVRDEENGTIMIDGNRWRVEEPQIYFAESATVRPRDSNGGES